MKHVVYWGGYWLVAAFVIRLLVGFGEHQQGLPTAPTWTIFAMATVFIVGVVILRYLNSPRRTK